MEIVMPQISRTALVPYSAEQMYQLVNDVQSYPCLLYTSPSPRDATLSRMPSSA